MSLTKVFISYSRADAQFVSLLSDLIGRSACIYDELFEISKSSIDNIYNSIDESGIFLIVLSENSIESEYVKLEMKRAYDKLQQIPDYTIVPISISESLRYNDPRIPEWLRKFHIKNTNSHFMVAKSIKETLRLKSWKNFPSLKQKETFFVGRNDIINQIEERVISFEKSKPTAIIAHGIPGVGRRTALKQGLIKSGILKEHQEPIVISFEAKESVEDYIIKISEVLGQKIDTVLIEKLHSFNLTTKVDYSVDITNTLITNGEILFIEDNGSIILPNKELSPWFLSIINSNKIKKQTICLCIISKFKVSEEKVYDNDKIFQLSIPPLTKKESAMMFHKLMDIQNRHIEKEHAIEFINNFNGMPKQIGFTVDMIAKNGATHSIKNIDKIIEYGINQISHVIDLYRENSLAMEILIILSSFEFISFELLVESVKNKNYPEIKIMEVIEDLHHISIIELIGPSKEYIKLVSSISDYFSRTKSNLPDSIAAKIRNNIKNILSDSKTIEFDDYPDFLITMKSIIKEGHKLPSRYLIPSFLLKTIVDLYNAGKYSNVIVLSSDILGRNNKIDHQILREIRYWLCLSYAREKDETNFMNQIVYFEDGSADYHFLSGFYNRCIKKISISEKHFKKCLSISPSFSRAKRELVTVYLLQKKYEAARKIAEANYKENKYNIFHIQAYFDALIEKRDNLLESDVKMLNKLLEGVKTSIDRKSQDFYIVMKAKYINIVEKNLTSAIVLLENSLKTTGNKYYIAKELSILYDQSQRYKELDTITKKYNITDPDDIEFYQ
ncbi:MAG: TIR domain-containing protein [Rickettsiaceae bacterium]|nr:TIR domain-containing protein [Rickettsiaceae bacterium]